MKRGRRFVFLASFILIIFLSFVSAASQTVSISPTAGEAGVFQVYNITLTDTDTTKNITQVNLTTSTSSLNATSFNTSTNATIILSGQILTFNNNSISLIENGTSGYFWFNATSTQTGDFSITLLSLDSSGNTNSTSATIAISDTISPVIDFVSPTPSGSSSTLNASYIQANVTASDSGSGLKNITIYLYNSTRNLIDSHMTTSPSSFYFYNFTGLDDETYYLNATTYDNATHSASTSTKTIELDTTLSCTPNWVCTWGECADNLQSKVCSDSNSCGVTTGKPTGTQACVSCVTEWDCTAWSPSSCSTGSNQTRLCTDSNACVAPETETRTCVITSGSNLNATLPLFSSSFLFFVVLGAIILSIGGVVFILMRLKKKSASSDSNSDNSGYKTYSPPSPPPGFPPPSSPPGYPNPPRSYPNNLRTY